jgi:hypothetical protein
MRQLVAGVDPARLVGAVGAAAVGVVGRALGMIFQFFFANRLPVGTGDLHLQPLVAQ